jgi:hypothetical protein
MAKRELAACYQEQSRRVQRKKRQGHGQGSTSTGHQNAHHRPRMIDQRAVRAIRHSGETVHEVAKFAETPFPAMAGFRRHPDRNIAVAHGGFSGRRQGAAATVAAPL